MKTIVMFLAVSVAFGRFAQSAEVSRTELLSIPRKLAIKEGLLTSCVPIEKNGPGKYGLPDSFDFDQDGNFYFLIRRCLYSRIVRVSKDAKIEFVKDLDFAPSQIMTLGRKILVYEAHSPESKGSFLLLDFNGEEIKKFRLKIEKGKYLPKKLEIRRGRVFNQNYNIEIKELASMAEEVTGTSEVGDLPNDSLEQWRLLRDRLYKKFPEAFGVGLATFHGRDKAGNAVFVSVESRNREPLLTALFFSREENFLASAVLKKSKDLVPSAFEETNFRRGMLIQMRSDVKNFYISGYSLKE